MGEKTQIWAWLNLSPFIPTVGPTVCGSVLPIRSAHTASYLTAIQMRTFAGVPPTLLMGYAIKYSVLPIDFCRIVSRLHSTYRNRERSANCPQMGYNVHKFVVWVFPKEHTNPQRCCASMKDATFCRFFDLLWDLQLQHMLASEGKGSVMPQTPFGLSIRPPKPKFCTA